MRKKVAIGIVITVNVLLFIGTMIGLIATKKNIEIINTTDRAFYYDEGTERSVRLVLPSGKEAYLEFGESAVKVKESGRIERREELYIILFVQSYTAENGIEMLRTNADLWGELRLHKFLYLLGYKRNKTQDTDLDYAGDRRWYVRVASEILGWFEI